MMKKILTAFALTAFVVSSASAASVGVDNKGGVSVHAGGVKADNKGKTSATVKTKKGNSVSVGNNGASVKTKKGGVGVKVK